MKESWTIAKLLDWAAGYFKNLGIDSPRLEAEILLAYTLKAKRIELYIHHERALSEKELARFKEYILRRSRREPTAYITSHQPFFSMDFHINQSVLIPRPETEELVELALDLIKKEYSDKSSINILDVGTGSGVIAISLAKYFTNIKALGIDKSLKALNIATQNAAFHKVEDQCRFIQGDLFNSITDRFDVIISNPPYIPSNEISTLQPEARDWEPRSALDGGKDGMDFLSKIIQDGPEHLHKKGFLLLEFGIDQADKIVNLGNARGFTSSILNDRAGKERFYIGKL